MDMKKYTFHHIVEEDVDFDIDLYYSDDLPAYRKYCSMSDCLSAVLLFEDIIDPDLTDVVDEFTLESLLIDNNIYVEFVEE